MPRDSSGNYTLPLGNPVVDGTIIDVNWANPTMNDIAVQLNNVLTRDGLLGPIAPFFIVDGTEALPGLAFISQNGSGLWRDATQVGLSVNGVAKQVWSSAGSQVNGNFNVTGDFNVVGSGPYVKKAGDTMTGTLDISTVAPLAISASKSIQIAGDKADYAYILLNAAGTNLLTVRMAAGFAAGTVFDASSYAYSIGGTEAMRITSSGNVGIGTSAPDVKLHVAGPGATPRLRSQSTDASGVIMEFTADGSIAGSLGVNTNHPLVFTTFSQERMRIDQTGNVGIGATPGGNLSGGSSRLNLAGSGNVADCALLIINVGDGYGSGIQSACRFDAPSGWHFRAYGNTSVFSGGIQQVNATTIAFPTTSDVRRKKNVVDAPDQGAVIDALVVREFEFICEPDVKRIGFIAQEVFDVVPGAVIVGGEDVDQNPWMIDYVRLLPLAIAEIKSLRQRVAALGG